MTNTDFTNEPIVQRRIEILGWSFKDASEKRPVTPRPSNDAYYMRIAGQVALRSTCARRAVGCVITDKNNYIISTGYNGVASGLSHCIDSPCPGAESASGQDLHKCQARHAEDVALMKCKDIHAIDTVYCTTAPCIDCVRRLLDTSCSTIIFCDNYPSDGKKLWENSGRDWIMFGQKK